ncbi:DRMBL domain-containing protein [Citrus sinensis]|nr:DRMBL domain-containing protein [Citrus sinensis]
MHLLGFHDTFTTKTSLARVRAVPRYSFSIDTLENLNTMHQTIGIMPSGLPWVVKPLKGGIEEFLNRAQPSNIRGIVSSSSCYVDPLYYFGHLCRANQPSLRYKQQQRVQHKTVVAAQMKFIVESGRSTKVDRKRRTAEVGILGVRMSKVDALRRARRGAKLARSESSD